MKDDILYHRHRAAREIAIVARLNHGPALRSHAGLALQHELAAYRGRSRARKRERRRTGSATGVKLES